LNLALKAVKLPGDAVEVGRVLDAWGVKGWIKVLPFSPQPEALFSSKRWFLLPAERGVPTFNGPVLLPITEVKEHAEVVVASSHVLPDRNTAELLRGARIFIPRSSFPTAAPQEYYWVDLIGLKVVNLQAIELGVVVDLMATGPQTVLVVHEEVDDARPKPTERLIPFVSEYVIDVGLSSRTIKVDWQPDF
jgi:16S rRNA processing protein RimM